MAQGDYVSPARALQAGAPAENGEHTSAPGTKDIGCDVADSVDSEDTFDRHSPDARPTPVLVVVSPSRVDGISESRRRSRSSTLRIRLSQ